MTGQLFGDRYQVGDTLGFGGMSEVHRGRDLRLGRDVAIKVLRADLARDPSFQTRFRREAQNAASLNHPAIVAVYDTGETASATGDGGTVPYIVMEYVDGETLRDLLKREGPLDPKRAMEIVADVCAALDFSHRHGIVHRDIKPANVMLTRAGAVKVMDFGIARAVADGQSTMTATSAVIGTAQYLSPEQARGEAVDARSDVYSTGCVLYELLTGQPPFTGDSPVAVAYQHVREEPKAPSATRPGLARELDAIVLKALNKNPLNRYQSAAEMRSDLVRALSGQAVHAPRVMDDNERTELMGPNRPAAPAPAGVSGGGPSATPPILAPPQRIMPEQHWQEEQENSRAKKVWGYLGIGVICLALLAGAIFLTIKFISKGPPPPDIPVPSLAGMTQEQATAKLTSLQLQLGKITRVESSNADKNKIVDQNPSGNTPEPPGTKIAVSIGQGVQQVTVPNLASLKEGDAKAKLTSLGLQMQPIPTESVPGQQGLVLKQDPAADASVTPNTVVKVYIGNGPNLVQIPDGLVGKSLTDATAALKAVKLGVTPQYKDSPLPKDQVLAIPGHKAGDKVAEGSPIPLTLSNQSQFLMPDVTSEHPTPEVAVTQLKLAKWLGDITTLTQTPQEVPDQAQWGRIIAQTPPPTTPFSRTGAIKVTVGAEPTFIIPNVQGSLLLDAENALHSLGWQGPETALAVDNTDVANNGKVIDIEPIQGQKIKILDPITIHYYKTYTPPPPPPPTTATTPTTAPT
ncbi:MAG: Stk1 family PASTA domain-containing Ser/Thr kinase, partial [Actinomycetota bacterium]|nr:Stk1 family PASTA domain-containing Ser/Thr kinase [Actinomycetota bacterium]